MKDIRIKVTCEYCGKEVEMPRGTYYARKRNNKQIQCRECFKKNLSEYRKQHCQNMTPEEKEANKKQLAAAGRKRWDEIDDVKLQDFKNKVGSKNRQRWSQKSEEEKIIGLKKLQDGHNKWYNSLDDDGKREWIDSINKGMEHIDQAEVSRQRKEMWINKSEEEKEAYREKKRQWWKNLPEEEKQKYSDRARQQWDSMNEYEYNEMRQLMRDGWQNMSKESHDAFVNKCKTAWNNKPEEFMVYWRALNKARWDNKSDEEKQEISDKAKERWKNMPAEYKNEHSKRMSESAQEQWNSMSDDDRNTFIYHLLHTYNEWYESLTDEEKKEMHRDRMLKCRGDNSFVIKFENRFECELGKYYYYIKEYITKVDEKVHHWDYAVFDQCGDLECLIDIDGAYFHGDNCDYDGIRSRIEYDERRGLFVPDGVKCYIVYEKEFDKSFKYLLDTITLSYDEFVDKRFKEYRMIPFPYPTYKNNLLVNSFNVLSRLDCDDECYDKLNVNTRLGDRIIYNFHYSIFHAHVGSNKSPHDIWKNDEQLRDMIYNHELLHNYINKNKILQGFNLKYRVPFMSAGMARLIIHHYLSEYDEIFDPFSEFSGRLLGAISLGKKYIGQDASEISVRESNQILDWLRDNMYEVDVHISCTDSSKTTGNYQCLFTSLPRRGESYEDVPETTLTCDEWINVCLKNYSCKSYLFIVDNTNEYKDNIINEINGDRLILIRR